jgi:hypothetical protein
MKVSDFLSYVFLIVFIVFALFFIDYQNDAMTGAEGSSRVWLTRVYLLIDLVCCAILIYCLNRKYSGIHLVCISWIVIMPILMYIDRVQVSDIIKTFLWPLLFETTYLCCRWNVSRGDTLKTVFWGIAIIGFSYFIVTRIGADHQTNTIYFCSLTMPWLIYKTSKRTTLILLFVFSFLVLLSLKRSTMLAMVVIWSFYFLFGLRRKRQIAYTVVISIVVLAGLYFAYDKIDERMGGLLTERVNREETDSGKDREAIWLLTTSMIQQSSPSELIKGHGHFGVRRDSWLEISAHNDFLEVIYDYGLIIFFLYLCLWGHVVRRAYKLFRIRSPLFLPYSASLGIFIVMSMVSHLILYATYFNFLVMFWAMTEALVETENKKRDFVKRFPK